MRIELLLQELALMDSNNYPGKEGGVFYVVQGLHPMRGKLYRIFMLIGRAVTKGCYNAVHVP